MYVPSNMTERLESALDSENLTNNVLSRADGDSNSPRFNYESDNDSEKPILLELGATPYNQKKEISTVAYSVNYPLDLQLNSAFDSDLPTPSYNFDRAVLFNNPYNNRMSAALSQTPLASVPQSIASSTPTHLKSIHYSAHIPQPVYSWSTPVPAASIVPTYANSKLPAEVVPPPVYMTYSEDCEHTITKQTNHSWKEKVLQTEKDYKKTACDRERTRMRDMNRAFDQLRSKLPISKPNGKKYSKIESLRIAINYINHLQNILNDNVRDATSPPIEDFHARSRSNSYRLENYKSNALQDTTEKCENLDESRSTWSDSYVANSQDKWD